jgi:hypothetical protein
MNKYLFRARKDLGLFHQSLAESRRVKKLESILNQRPEKIQIG